LNDFFFFCSEICKSKFVMGEWGQFLYFTTLKINDMCATARRYFFLQTITITWKTTFRLVSFILGIITNLVTISWLLLLLLTVVFFNSRWLGSGFVLFLYNISPPTLFICVSCVCCRNHEAKRCRQRCLTHEFEYTMFSLILKNTWNSVH